MNNEWDGTGTMQPWHDWPWTWKTYPAKGCTGGWLDQYRGFRAKAVCGLCGCEASNSKRAFREPARQCDVCAEGRDLRAEWFARGGHLAALKEAEMFMAVPGGRRGRQGPSWPIPVGG